MSDKFIKQYEKCKRAYWQKLERCFGANFYKLYKTLLEAWGIVWIIGNGGSLAIAEHVALDLTKITNKRAIAVGGAEIITAYSNDISFEHGIATYLTRLWEERDILIALSTSGESPNIIAAVREAKRAKVLSFALTSKDSTLAKEAEMALEFEEKDPKVLEDIFQIVFHFLTKMLEDAA